MDLEGKPVLERADPALGRIARGAKENRSPGRIGILAEANSASEHSSTALAQPLTQDPIEIPAFLLRPRDTSAPRSEVNGRALPHILKEHPRGAVIGAAV